MTTLFLIEQVLNGLQSGNMLFLMAAGLTLILGVMGPISLAHRSLYMVGALAAIRVKSRKPAAEYLITSLSVTRRRSSATPTIV